MRLLGSETCSQAMHVTFLTKQSSFLHISSSCFCSAVSCSLFWCLCWRCVARFGCLWQVFSYWAFLHVLIFWKLCGFLMLVMVVVSGGLWRCQKPCSASQWQQGTGVGVLFALNLLLTHYRFSGFSAGVGCAVPLVAASALASSRCGWCRVEVSYQSPVLPWILSLRGQALWKLISFWLPWKGWGLLWSCQPLCMTETICSITRDMALPLDSCRIRL